MTSFMHKIRDFSTPSLFILQFISYKTKVLTLFWDESYHNTSSYHVNKKKYNTSLQLTYLATFKSLYPTSTCVNFLKKGHMLLYNLLRL